MRKQDEIPLDIILIFFIKNKKYVHINRSVLLLLFFIIKKKRCLSTSNSNLLHYDVIQSN
jgi:hypothetical protein